MAKYLELYHSSVLFMLLLSCTKHDIISLLHGDNQCIFE